jgi:hypothetical protein
MPFVELVKVDGFSSTVMDALPACPELCGRMVVLKLKPFPDVVGFESVPSFAFGIATAWSNVRVAGVCAKQIQEFNKATAITANHSTPRGSLAINRAKSSSFRVVAGPGVPVSGVLIRSNGPATVTRTVRRRVCVIRVRFTGTVWLGSGLKSPKNPSIFLQFASWARAAATSGIPGSA